MNPKNEARLTELEAKPNRTPQEEAVRVALLELDEKSEALATAEAAHPVPDPVVQAKADVDAAQKAVDDAEAAVKP